MTFAHHSLEEGTYPQPLEHPGMVTIKLGSELPTFKELLESSLVGFLANDFLDDSRQ